MLSFFVFMSIFFVCVLALETLHVQSELRELRKDFNEWRESTHWVEHGDLEKCIEASQDEFLNAYSSSPVHENHIGYKEISLSDLHKTRCIKCGEKLSWHRVSNKTVPCWEAVCSSCNQNNFAIINPAVIVSAHERIDLTTTVEMIRIKREPDDKDN